ncbi:MAG: hypothetical protein HY653_03805 [Acidobacteria bacterium]|nr:hypothetical protein [Acidobacteriota bacterium]
MARSFRHTNLRFELKAVGLLESQLVCDDWGAHDLLLLPVEEGKGNRALARFPLRSLAKGKIYKAWVEFICKVVLE